MTKPIRAIASLIVIPLFAVACTTATQKTPPASAPQAETRAAPPAAPVTTPAPARAPAVTRISYTVVRGDHLWGIASKVAVYGNPYEWPLIFKSNRDTISDPDLVYPGQVLSIDKSPSSADVSAAIRHAKTRGPWKLGTIEKSDRDYVAAYAMK